MPVWLLLRLCCQSNQFNIHEEAEIHVSASFLFQFDKRIGWVTFTKMTDENVPKENPAAVFPDPSTKPFSLVVVEEYLSKCDEALTKLQESMVKLRANMKQREDETIAINAQRQLLQALQKQFVKEPTK